jgi:hypothetical protein
MGTSWANNLGNLMGINWEQGEKINPVTPPLLYLKMKTSIEGMFKVSNFFL